MGRLHGAPARDHVASFLTIAGRYDHGHARMVPLRPPPCPGLHRSHLRPGELRRSAGAGPTARGMTMVTELAVTDGLPPPADLPRGECGAVLHIDGINQHVVYRITGYVPRVRGYI